MADDLILSDDDFDAVREQLRAAWRRANPLAPDASMPETIQLSEAALAFAEKAHTGLLVALWLPEDAAAALALPDGEPAANLHVTLCYCGDADALGELAVVRAIAAVDREVRWRSSLSGKIGGYGRFLASDTSDGQDVFYAAVDVPGLAELREAVSLALMEAGSPPSTRHGWTPHITLAYVDADADNPTDRVPATELRFDAVTVMAGSRRIDIPFSPPLALFAVHRDNDAHHIAVVQPARFADPPEWAPFLPIPGEYTHPIYGFLDFSPDRYDRIIANFQSGAYQERLPVNAEHDAMSSGAVGWITDMRRGGDGGIEAKVEWNDRGIALITDDRYRYVSAEWFDVWTDPVTGEAIPDVAVGLALTTHPYFKESVLRPLAASEAVLTRVSAGAPGDAGDSGKERTMPEDPTVTTATEPTTPETDSAVKQLTERILAELGGKDASITSPVVEEFVGKVAAELAQRDARTKAAEDQAKTLAEQNALLQAQHRVKVFTDEVTGRSAENGVPYIGHIPDMVRMLCDLAEKFGPDSWQVQHYKALNRSHAESIKAGSLFTTIGVGRGGETTQTAHDQLTAIAREVAARTPGKTEAQAYTEALDANPDLKATLARERREGRS